MTTTISNRLVVLRGTNAATFAQAQFSCDVLALRPGQWRFGAWLSAQGRVRAWFELLRADEETFFVHLRDGDAAALIEPLRRFVLRTRVVIEPSTLPDTPPPAAVGDAPHLIHAIGTNWQLRLPGTDAIVMPGTEPSGDMRRAEITAGIARVPEVLAESLVPAWLEAERLGAVSLRKGCYPGQEIVARMHYRGHNTRRLVRVAISGGPDPSAQTLRTVEGIEAGVILRAVAGTGTHAALAVLREGLDASRLRTEAGVEVEVLSTDWPSAG